MSTSSAIRDIGPRFFEAQDRLRGGPDRDLCAPDYRIEIAGNPPLDYAGHEQFAKAFYSAFPDLSHRIEDVVAEGDRVVVRFALCGTHTGNFMGIPPTGREVAVPMALFCGIEAGKIRRGELRRLFE